MFHTNAINHAWYKNDHIDFENASVIERQLSQDPWVLYIAKTVDADNNSRPLPN